MVLFDIFLPIFCFHFINFFFFSIAGINICFPNSLKNEDEKKQNKINQHKRTNRKMNNKIEKEILYHLNKDILNEFINTLNMTVLDF